MWGPNQPAKINTLLTDPSGPIISTPSPPDGDTDGFNVAYGSVPPLPPMSQQATATAFTALQPFRVCDTRSGSSTECSGSPLGQGQSMNVQVIGVDGIPAAGGSSPPVAVIANVTAVSGTSFTYFTLYPADSPSTPNASDLNVNVQQNTPNLTIVQLAKTGTHVGAVDLYKSLGSINAIVDVAGWFQ